MVTNAFQEAAEAAGLVLNEDNIQSELSGQII